MSQSEHPCSPVAAPLDSDWAAPPDRREANHRPQFSAPRRANKIPTPSSAEWMSTHRAAAELGGVAPNGVARWCLMGLVKGAVRLPGKSGWRIPRKGWDQFLRSRTPKAARLSANEEDATHE